MQLSITSNNLDKLQDNFAQIQKRGGDVSQAIDGVCSLVSEDVGLRFAGSPSVESGGTVWGGVTWLPLTEYTLRLHPDRKGGKLLIDTHKLELSFIKGNPDNIATSTRNNEMVFGTRVPYAPKLQKKRPIIFWHDVLYKKVLDYLQAWIVYGVQDPNNPPPERNSVDRSLSGKD